MERIRYLFVLVILLSHQVRAQDIKLEAEYPGVVVEGEQFTIVWTVNSREGDFEAPVFTGFYKLGGPQTSFSSSTQIINGKMSQKTSYSYVYFLQAMKEGKYSLGPATVKIKNKEYRSDSIRIEVIANRSGAPQAKQGPQDEADVTGGEVRAAGDLFLRVILNRDNVYIGEPVTATVKLYTRIDISGLNDIKYPSFNSFLKEDIQTPEPKSLKRENIDGVIYGTAIVQQFLLFPQVAGDLTIDPVEVTALVQQRSGQNDPFFGDFFSTYVNVPKVVVSQPVKIKVKMLPGNQPQEFSGVVGKADISAAINKDTVNVNDAINLKITVSGSGNIKFAGLPSLKISPDIEVYDPKVSENINYSSAGATGQKVFEYVLIPRHYGEFTIPSVAYSYFNSSSRQYERLATEELRFYVRKGQGTASDEAAVYSGVTASDVKYLGKDIRFIKTSAGNVVMADNVLLLKRSFLALYGFSILLFALVLIVRREHVKRNSDISMVRNRRAARIAKKRLKAASECLKNGTIDRFYEEILKALWGFLSDKLSIPVSNLNRVNAGEALKIKGVPDETVSDLMEIIDKCEFARFAPASSGGEQEKIFEGASLFISSIENKIS
jgi:hypothetical protein